jgi:cardiolipin synthase
MQPEPGVVTRASSTATPRPRRRPSRLVVATRVLFRGRPWWETTILLVGLVASLTFVGVAFFGVDAKPEVVTVSDDIGAVGSPEFLAAVSRLVGAPVEAGGEVTILNNGDEFMPALLDAIRRASTSINVSVFMWQDGTLSARVLEALVERQRAGVAVRILLDGLASLGATDPQFEELAEAGGRVASFRMPRLGSWMRIHRRNHRRAIVLDGKVGFTGGMGMNDKWLGRAQDPDHWRDMMFQLTGPMAASLQAAFADVWAGTTGEILAGPAMYPSVAPAGDTPKFIHLASSPADDDHSMAYFLLTALFAARDRVVIATPYFIPDIPMRRTLVDRARAGIKITMLLPGDHIDNPQVRLSGQNHYQSLMDAGVEIWEYQPTFLHSKVMVVDGRWSIIGSPNLNTRSRQLDEENAYGILDESLGAALEAVLAADRAKARRIDPEQWRRRSPFTRLLQLLSRITDNQS